MISNVVIILQARLTSKRFPNKMLCPLGGKPVLQWTIEACAKSGYPFVIAIPNTKTNLGINSVITPLFIKKMKIHVRTGSEEDLVDRFIHINKEFNFDPIIRICGDNPFFNHEDIDLALDIFKKRLKYTRLNHVEVFSRTELEYVDKNDPFIERRGHCVQMLSQTVDYPEDIERLEREWGI